jgi:hypothetical protein
LPIVARLNFDHNFELSPDCQLVDFAN